MKILEEEPPLADECKLPWIIDAFLYPISAAGMIHIAVFVFVPRVVLFFISKLVLFLKPILREGVIYVNYLTIPFYVVFYSYMYYYIAYCVVNSSKGIRRASDAPILETFSIGDFVAQVILIFGCIAVCFWPVAIYYVLIRQDDIWFWLLLAWGIFFLPMSLLRGVLFDAFDALNPIEIFRSIGSTFFSYCGLVLFFVVVGGFLVVLLPPSLYWWLTILPLLCAPLWFFLVKFIRFYLIFVLAHRLGWFYWWHKDKLDWGI